MTAMPCHPPKSGGTFGVITSFAFLVSARRACSQRLTDKPWISSALTE
jgi:hypothetical protein